MTENKSNAKSELGQLFVDIGIPGLGSVLKGLNTLSASFLLTKNAAKQFAQPLINMSKSAGNDVKGLEKINAIMDMSLTELKQLENWSKANHVDFGSMINQLQTVQDKLMDIRTGRSNDISGLSMLGLTAYDFDPKRPMDFINKVMAKLKDVDKVTAETALRWLGLSTDWLFISKQNNGTIDDRLQLNKQELKQLSDTQSAWDMLNVTWKAAQEKFIANQTWINKLLAKTTDLINKTSASAQRGSLVLDFVDKVVGWYNENVYMSKINKRIAEYQSEKDYAIEMAKKTKNPKLKEIYVTKAEEANKKLKAAKATKEKYMPKTDKTLFELSQERKGISTSKEQKQNNNGNAVSTSIQPQQPTNNFGLRGSQLLSAEPIEDFSTPQAVNSYTVPALPPSLQGGNNAAMSTPPTSNINNNISFEINQTITGDNPQQIAAASANAIDEASLNILQAQNQWAV